jgi:hypothetical protein
MQNRAPANRAAAGGRGNQQSGGANGDGEMGDDDGVTLSEFNRWLVQEENWASAEEARESYMEGAQFRKTRDERHRERGMERQAASIEQMKLAKGRVEDHRQENLEQGKVRHSWLVLSMVLEHVSLLPAARVAPMMPGSVHTQLDDRAAFVCTLQSVRDNVQMWKANMYESQEAWIKQAKQKREQALKSVSAKEERKKLLDFKKIFSKKVKDEVTQFVKAGEELRTQQLQQNKERAAKVKAGTADEVTDEAKKMFFDQRIAAAKAIRVQVEAWERDKVVNQTARTSKQLALREKSKAMEAAARGARKNLAAEKARNAAEIRRQKQEAAQTHRAEHEDRIADTKQLVNSAIGNKFVQSAVARRMLQHPHYAEVSAVVTDVTSQISKEIAASPRRRPPAAIAGAIAGKQAAPLRTGSASQPRTTA